MRDRDALALDVGAAHRGGVEQQVDQVVVQQVDLVDVEHAAVRGGQQPGLVGASRPSVSARSRSQRADHPVLGGADRQLDQPWPGGARAARRPGAGRPGRPGRARPGRRRTGSRRPRRPAAAARPAPRTMVDFAVPFSPRTSTPPMAGDTALSSSASFRSVHPDDGGERIRAAADYYWRSSPQKPVLPGFPRPKWRNSTAAGVSGSRSRRRPRGSPPVTVAGQPRIRTGVPPRRYLSTA